MTVVKYTRRKVPRRSADIFKQLPTLTTLPCSNLQES